MILGFVSERAGRARKQLRREVGQEQEEEVLVATDVIHSHSRNITISYTPTVCMRDMNGSFGSCRQSASPILYFHRDRPLLEFSLFDFKVLHMSCPPVLKSILGNQGECATLLIIPTTNRTPAVLVL